MSSQAYLPKSSELAESPVAPSDYDWSPQTGMDNSVLQELLQEQPLTQPIQWEDSILGQVGPAAAAPLDGAALQQGLDAHKDPGWADLPMFEEAMRASPLAECPEDMAKKNAAFRLRERYDANPKALTNDQMSAKVDLSDPKARLDFLNSFTQNANSDQRSAGAMCGPTALMGGAMLADGERGLGTLIDAVEGLKGDASPDPAVADIRKRIAAGEQLSRMDLDFVQDRLYKRLNLAEGHDVEKATPEQLADPKFAGVKGATLNSLLEKNSDLQKLFLDNHMSLSGVDLGGENGKDLDHWVMRMEGVDGLPKMVYDPQARRGGQVVGRSDATRTEEDYRKFDTSLKTYDFAERLRLYGQPNV